MSRKPVFICTGLPWACPALGMSYRELARHLTTIAEIVETRLESVEVHLVSDKETAEANQRFRGLEGPTNILSFPLDDNGLEGVLLVNMNAVEREAALAGVSLAAHFVRLIVHGVLHLDGWEHGTAMFLAMDEAVDRFFSSTSGFTKPLLPN